MHSKKLLHIYLIICGLIFTILISGFFNRYNFKINQVTIESKKLPEVFNGFKIVAFSDMHLITVTSSEAIKKLVDSINSQNPDIVCFLGDMVSYNSKELVKFETEISKIKSKYGIFAILGNHDYGTYQKWESPEEQNSNMEILYKTYDKMGWYLLKNQSDYITINNDTILIAGVHNWGTAGRFPKLANMETTIEGKKTNYYTILLSHDPSYWENFIKQQYPFVDITLSGHTHGGQIGIVHNNNNKTLFSLFNRYSNGMYSNENNPNQKLFISIGAGEVGFPGRIGIGQEIVSITLKRK